MSNRKRSSSRKNFLRRRACGFQVLESRQLLAGDWQNPSLPQDVNDDDAVSPIDALMVINELNRSGGAVEVGVTRSLDRNFYPDVSGNGDVSPIDALMIINHLNQAEGEQVPPPAPNLQATGVRPLSGTLISPDGNLNLILDIDNAGDPFPNTLTAVLGTIRVLDMQGMVVAEGNESTIFRDDFNNNEILLSVSLNGLPEGLYDVQATIDTTDVIHELSETDNTIMLMNAVSVGPNGAQFDADGFDPEQPPQDPNGDLPTLFELVGLRSAEFDDDVELELVVNNAMLEITSPGPNLLEFRVPGFQPLVVPITADLELEIGGINNTLMITNVMIPDDLEIELEGRDHSIELRNVQVGDDFIFEGSRGADNVLLDANTIIGDDAIIDTEMGDDIVVLQDVTIGDDLEIETEEGDDLVVLERVEVLDDLEVELGDDDDELSAVNVDVGDDLEFDGDDELDFLAINAATIVADEADVEDFEAELPPRDVDALIMLLF